MELREITAKYFRFCQMWDVVMGWSFGLNLAVVDVVFGKGPLLCLLYELEWKNDAKWNFMHNRTDFCRAK